MTTQFSAFVKAKEQFSEGGGAWLRFNTSTVPGLKLEKVNGQTSVVIASAYAEPVVMDHKDNPKLTYAREAKVILSLSTCEEIVRFLVAENLLRVQAGHDPQP